MITQVVTQVCTSAITMCNGCQAWRIIFPVVLAALTVPNVSYCEPSRILYLSGTGNDDTKLWQFRVSGGRNASFWTNIPVPSCWETVGFGSYEYGWDSTDEIGEYRCMFSVPSEWMGKRVFIVFEGVMTDTEVWVNGRAPGAPEGFNGTGGIPNDRAFDNTLSSPGGIGGIARANGNLALGSLSTFTLSCWIKSASTLGSGFQRLMLIGSTNYDARSGQSGAYFGVYNSGTVTNALQFKINGDTGNGAISPPGIVSGTDWLFVAVAFDAGLPAGNVKFYVGTKTNPLGAPVATVNYGNGATVNFGSAAFAYFLNRNTQDRAFHGWGDDFRIYMGALEQATLEAIRISALDPTVPHATNGLIYHWSFNTPNPGTTVAPDVGMGGVLAFYDRNNNPADLLSMIGTGVSGGSGQVINNRHQGGFYEFRFEVTSNVVFGASTNLLEVKVYKKSANASVNRAERQADYWVFGGIYRPVYLEAKPYAHIERIATDARADGQIKVHVFLSGIDTNYLVSANVREESGTPLGNEFGALVEKDQTNVLLAATLPAPKPWSAESPNLYILTVTLMRDGFPVHTVSNLIGFRTIAFTNDLGFFVNGKKVVLRGVNRHEFWPTTGRTVNRDISIQDVELIKGMNANAVRLSHYPPSKEFLEECDRRGLYVLDELAGWQAAYDNSIAPVLIREMVVRDVNHPCIIAWCNGNEGGHNITVDHDGPGATNVFAIYDPQNRRVLRPTTGSATPFNDVVTYHYASYNTFTNLLGQRKTVFMPTEILHALFDGGGGAGLADHWDAMRTASNGGGMFIWALIDEGLVRDDMGRQIDVAGDAAPDGVVGPYREKEASYFAIKAIWSPVQVFPPDPSVFDGTLSVENRFDFTDLRQCMFRWQLGWFPDPGDPTNVCERGLIVAFDSGVLSGPPVPPGSSGSLHLNLPADWRRYDALRLSAFDPFGRELYTWTWPLRSPHDIASRVLEHTSQDVSQLAVAVSEDEIIVSNKTHVFRFDKASGKLNGCMVNGRQVSLTNGPRPVTNSWPVESIAHGYLGQEFYLAVNYASNGVNKFCWHVRPDGWLGLKYELTLTGAYSWIGVTFDYPETNVLEFSWLGQGPFRVWKNRTQGQDIFVHRKSYNNTSTGKTWDYPEFCGYHGQFYWGMLGTTEAPIAILSTQSNLYFRLLTPPIASTTRPGVSPCFPPGNLSFLHAINPIGDKFHLASDIGPQGSLTIATGMYEGEIWFYFGQLPTSTLDRDSNGMFDTWELEHFGFLPVDPLADPDGDKMVNLLEFACGGDPLKPDAWLGRIHPYVVDHGSFAFSFRKRRGIAADLCTIQASTNMFDWIPAIPNAERPLWESNDIVMWEVTFPIRDSCAFYRIAYTK